jgi:hypothetical protein
MIQPEQVLSYRNSGISVIPLVYRTQFPAGKILPQVPHPKRLGETKGTWRPYRSQIATEKEIRAWFGSGPMSLAVVPGFVSNGLFVIDFDSEANRSIVAWQKAIGEALFRSLPIARTTKGYHVYVRSNTRVTNKILAKNEVGGILVEIKGSGSLCTAPPSERQKKGQARVTTYEWVQKDHTDIPFVSETEYFILLGELAQLNRFEKEPKKSQPLYIEPQSVQVDDEKMKNRIIAYSAGVMRNLLQGLSIMAQGGRNHELNKIAYIGARYIAAGLIEKEALVEQLRDACLVNRLIADDGEDGFVNTVNSAFFSGLRNPVDPAEVAARFK